MANNTSKKGHSGQVLDETMPDEHYKRATPEVFADTIKYYGDNCVAVTLTIKNKMKIEGTRCDNHDPIWLSTYLINKLRHYMSKRIKSFGYILYRELTKGGNPHFHGIFYSDQYYNIVRVLKYWRRHFGFILQKPLFGDTNKWSEYCHKLSNVDKGFKREYVYTKNVSKSFLLSHPNSKESNLDISQESDGGHRPISADDRQGGAQQWINLFKSH